MKHYVLGLVFNRSKNKILLVDKKAPKWMVGYWNGIGGKIKRNEAPLRAMERESTEETNYSRPWWKHIITFVCPGGTIFVFKSITPCGNANSIPFEQNEDETLKIWPLHNLPDNMMRDLFWIIPLSLSSVQFPVIIQQNKLGVEL